jgi:hypothetical protein
MKPFAFALLSVALLAASNAPAQPAPDAVERDFARGFYAGFVEAREIDARCELLEPERRKTYADNMEYLRQDTLREYGAAVIDAAEDLGKRHARDITYLDCGQTAMDRIEDRYERINTLVAVDRWKRETPEGREFAAKMTRALEEAQAEAAAEEQAAEPTQPEEPEEDKVDLKAGFVDMLRENLRVIRIEKRCRFLEDTLHARVIAAQETLARNLRNTIDDPAAVAAIESEPDDNAACNDDLSQRIRGFAERIEELEVFVQATDAMDAIINGARRKQDAAEAVDLSVPLPPPPANRPKPLTRAQKRKASSLEDYARSLRTQRTESRCRFLSDQAHERLLRIEARYTELLRIEIADPAAIAELDAASEVDIGCGQSQRETIEIALDVIGMTENIVEMMEATQADAPR